MASFHPSSLLARPGRLLRTRAGAARLLAAGLAAVAALSGTARALDPDRTLLQYDHTRWTTSQGAPAGISRMTQTRDGYLWLAAYDGLYRFDGITFERIDPQVVHAADDYPTGLLAARNGELWVYYHVSKRFDVFRGGRLTTFPAPKPEGTVPGLAQTPDGDIWVAGGRAGQPMLRYRAGKWTRIQPSGSYGRDTNMGMAISPDGALWVAYVNNVFRWLPAAGRFQHMISAPGAQMRLSVDPAGRVWVTGSGGSRPLTQPGGRWTGRPATFVYPSDNFARRGTPMFDRQGNLWVARRKDGIERLRTPSPDGPVGPPPVPEEFRATDGLTSDAVYTIFEDREGNVWAGTTRGLDRFRNSDIVFEPTLRQTAAYGDILFADRKGNVFIGQRNTVYRVEPGGRPTPVLSGVNEPEAICEGPGGALWVALADSFEVLGGQSRTRIAKPEGLETGVKDCGLDRWGRFWISAEADGLYLRTPTGWKPVPVKAEGRFAPWQMVHDGRGDLWVNAGPAGLVRFDSQGPVAIRIPGVERLSEIKTLSPAEDGLLLAGPEGMGLLRNERLSLVPARQVGTLLGVNGALRNERSETWVFTRSGLGRMRAADLERAVSNPKLQVPVRIFNVLDGLIDSNAVRTPRALVRGGDGRLWAATATGTVWIDPARLTFNPLAPKIAIRSIEYGGRKVRDPVSVRLPAGSSDISIGFAVLSLRMPERAQVRYRLVGQDAGWVDPGLRRQAFYTNLAPGNYRFEVMAANENGVWQRKASALEFELPPTFLQSPGFKLLLALAFAALLAAAYLVRVRQVTAGLQSRFDIRIAERERIARELHDTLLQGFQGLLLQFKAIANRLPEDNKMRQSLDSALVRAQQVLIEGRDRVKELRSRSDDRDLANALLERAGRQVAADKPRLFLTQEGVARSLHPLVREELERIIEEAVRNSAAHAQASAIEILLQWSRRELRLAVRDDGVGMPPSILASGERKGHFGLIGMRERAERIGGTLAVVSREAAGTEVTVAVPAQAAFEDQPSSWLDGLRARWRARAREPEMAA